MKSHALMFISCFVLYRNCKRFLTSSLFIFFSLKTSFLKWNPDLDGAVSEYIKAGKAYVIMCYINVHEGL